MVGDVSYTDPAANQITFDRLDELISDLLQFVDIFLSDGMRVHIVIHGGHDKYFCA